MSIDGTKLLFEGFLQKRKDKMKVRWVKYWFRLQNTTLFFYTKKNGCASHLRGHYYIYTVQSVREVHAADSKGFMFEIIMNSGKRKMLAAETAALRKEWVSHLWKAMHLSAAVVSIPRRTDDSETEWLPARPHSAPVPPGNSVTFPVCLSEELKKVCMVNSATETDDGVYDVPLCYGGVDDHQESIYDVPSCLLRKTSDHTIEEQLEEGDYLEDMSSDVPVISSSRP